MLPVVRAATKKAIWISRLHSEVQHLNEALTISVFIDNNGTIDLAHN